MGYIRFIIYIYGQIWVSMDGQKFSSWAGQWATVYVLQWLRSLIFSNSPGHLVPLPKNNEPPGQKLSNTLCP